MKEAGMEILKNIAGLLKVKTILSLLVIITTCILTFKGVIDVVAFMTITSAIITYYFTKKDTNDDKTVLSQENVETNNLSTKK